MRRALGFIVLCLCLLAVFAPAMTISKGGSASLQSGSTALGGGTDTDVCFNDAGVLNCGDAGLTFAKTTDILSAVAAKTGTFTADNTNGIGCDNNVPCISAEAAPAAADGAITFNATEQWDTSTGSTGIVLANGTAAVPAIIMTGDNDAAATGYYRSASNEWDFSANGNAIFAQDANGIYPAADNTLSLGLSSRGWGALYLQGSLQDVNVKTLAGDNSITSFVTISCASGDMVGGEVEYVVYAENGTTEAQAEAGTLQFNCINLTGTEVVVTPTERGTPLYAETTGGTADMTTTWAAIDGGTNAMTLRVTADTGMASNTLMEIRYRVHINSGTATVTAL